MELLILLSVLSYNPSKKQFLDHGDNQEQVSMSVDQLQRSFKSPEEYTPLTSDLVQCFDQHMQFVTSLAVTLAADKVAVLLLFYISLFSPDRPGIKDKEAISEQQTKYADLLQRYLAEKLPADVAKVRFPKLLMRLTELRSLTMAHTELMVIAGPENLSPLMQEVFEAQFAAQSRQE